MKVVNLYKQNYTVYIGRGSIFGNPFRIGKDGDREMVIKKYEFFVYEHKDLLKAILDLKSDDILGCFCKPKACHGDVICEIYNSCRR